MPDENEYGSVIPIIFRNPDSGTFWQGDPGEAPNDCEAVGWVKVGEDRIYIDQSSLDVASQIGKPKELLEPESLSSNSTKADIKRELVSFFKELEGEATFVELDHHIASRGYDPSGTYGYGEIGSAAMFWEADETYITAISELIDENKIKLYNPHFPGKKAEKYRDQASDLERSIPVGHLPLAKRPGEYSYKNPHWIPVYFKSGHKL
jgi:hypothetical protein